MFSAVVEGVVGCIGLWLGLVGARILVRSRYSIFGVGLFRMLYYEV